MKKIKTLSLTKLRHEEVFGFFKLVIAEIASLPTGETAPKKLTLAVDNMNTSYEAFDNVLERFSADPNVAIANAADMARDAAYRAMAAYIKAMCAHPDEEKAAQAQAFREVITKYGDPTNLSQTQESGVLHNLITEMNTFATDEFEKIYLDEWLTDLSDKEDEFLAAVKNRNRTESVRDANAGVVKEKRIEAEASYRELAEVVNAMVIADDETKYATFIDRVNAIIDRQKTVIKTRQTKGQKVIKPEEGGE